MKMAFLTEKEEHASSIKSSQNTKKDRRRSCIWTWTLKGKVSLYVFPFNLIPNMADFHGTAMNDMLGDMQSASTAELRCGLTAILLSS